MNVRQQPSQLQITSFVEYFTTVQARERFCYKLRQKRNELDHALISAQTDKREQYRFPIHPSKQGPQLESSLIYGTMLPHIPIGNACRLNSMLITYVRTYSNLLTSFRLSSLVQNSREGARQLRTIVLSANEEMKKFSTITEQ